MDYIAGCFLHQLLEKKTNILFYKVPTVHSVHSIITRFVLNLFGFLVLVLLSTYVKRFSVSLMLDLKQIID